MKLLVLLLCVAYANCFYTNNNTASKEKIIEGYDDTIEKANYMAALEKSGEHLCGAVIIAVNWLLSAAHCISNLENLRSILRVRLGTPHKEKYGEVYQLKNIIPHEDYNPSKFGADILLLEIDGTIKFDEKKDKIPLSKTFPVAGKTMKITGFGRKIEDIQPKDVWITSGHVKVIERDLCLKGHPILRNVHRIFCATSHPVDICQGDSGGPGVIDGELAGIIAGGHAFLCGIEAFPSFHTDISSFIPWIEKKTGLQF